MTHPAPGADSSATSSAIDHSGLPKEIEEAILRLAAACPAGRTLAPMDVAQAVAPGEKWQQVLPEVRRVALQLAEAGQLLIYRKGKPIDPAQLRGVYRLGLPRNG
ncbi:DUF3253 domain-containing protein [Xanthobacter sp. TB0136]|uniref:DUF3253 domain-containing protein n=1 Tax=Xanthobacter sp. TB0136 TaxID=3459177 RepID=UPI004039A6DB